MIQHIEYRCFECGKVAAYQASSVVPTHCGKPMKRGETSTTAENARRIDVIVPRDRSWEKWYPDWSDCWEVWMPNPGMDRGQRIGRIGRTGGWYDVVVEQGFGSVSGRRLRRRSQIEAVSALLELLDIAIKDFQVDPEEKLGDADG